MSDDGIAFGSMSIAMIAQPKQFVPSAQPSTTVINAAQNAASSQHAQINLIRMVKSLDKLDPSEECTNATRRRDWETVQYARVLLNTLQQSNEGSSNSSEILSDLDKTLRSVEIRYRNISATPTPSGPPPATVPLPASPTSRPISPSSESTPEALPLVEPARKLRQRVLNTEAYLRTRISEDREGDEAGLLPLKFQQARKEENERDSLLGGTRPGMGSAQLHEELGGQLADMSHRLKLNAVHFANSLEDEKSLLDTSTEVLEKNLAGTKVSKKHLSSVSSKGKGTTCMTLGIVLLVLIIFVWTYMLIRFT